MDKDSDVQGSIHGVSWVHQRNSPKQASPVTQKAHPTPSRSSPCARPYRTWCPCEPIWLAASLHLPSIYHVRTYPAHVLHLPFRELMCSLSIAHPLLPVPRSVIGTTSTPALTATLKAPFLNPAMTQSGLRVPSGKKSTGAPW